MVISFLIIYKAFPVYNNSETNFVIDKNMKNYFLLLSFLMILGCKNNESVADSKIQIQSLPKAKFYENANAAAADSAAVALDAPEAESEKITPQIIKNGTLRFETDDLATTFTQIQKAVTTFKGTIQNDSENKSDYTISRNLKIRIPSKNFDAFVSEACKGVNYFDEKEISSEDVTEEYVDVVSRIKTKKVLEERYLDLLKKASKISEMLEIEAQLSAIREEIEAKEGRLKYLKNQVSQSTINLSFYKTLASENGASNSFLSKIWNAIRSGFNSVLNFFIGLLEIWPFIAIFVAIIYFVRKRYKSKNYSDATNP